MNTILTNTLKTLAIGLLLAATIHSASATAIHTFVSGTGNDGNACTRALPCATFAGALAKTTSGGVITALDAADYGSVIIAQSVTIDGTGTQASIVTNSFVGAVVINNSASSDTVVLRHLTLTGLTSSGNGISWSTGNLVVDDCKITGFANYGIYDDSLGSAVVENTTIIGSGNVGIINLNAGAISLRNITLQGNNTALDAQGGAVEISHSLISQNTTGLFAQQATLSVLNCIVTGNTTAIYASSNSTIRLTNNDIFNNVTAISQAGTALGIVSTAGNNRKGGNPTPGAPTPGKVIVVQ